MDQRGSRSRLWAAISGILLASISACAQQAFDLDGHEENPLTKSSSRVVVLVFLRSDCPVSSRYAPVIQKISQKYAGRASFWLVYPDKMDSPETIRKYLLDYGYQLPALRDPQHVLVKLGHVQITPEVAVFDESRHLTYDGRIDDWYVELTRARPVPSTHELEEAIDAALRGKPPARHEVRGVGCYISDVE